MTGIPLIITFVVSIIIMIFAISKFKVHPFLAIMGIALLLAIVVGIPLIDIAATDTAPARQGIATIIGAGFSGTFSSIGIVIILGALVGTLLERTGAAIKLADMVVHLVGKKRPELAIMIMGWIVSIPVFCDSGFVILDPIRKALRRRTQASSVAMTVALSAGLYASHVLIPPTPGPIAAAGSAGLADNLILVMGMGALISIPALIAAYFYALIYRQENQNSGRSGRFKFSFSNIRTIGC
jgi:gluconate:H+ symporter, GntP family